MSNTQIAKSTQAATPAKPVITPVLERQYSLLTPPTSIPKGRQRQIVLAILLDAKKPMTPVEIAPLAEEMGLRAVGGILPSVRYHLHHMVKLGIAQVK
jgi:hypothetical protein